MKPRQNTKFDAILFDMVGVLLFIKKGFTPKTINEVNADKIEELYNHVDDATLLEDVKNKLKLTNQEIEDALKCIPKKFIKFSRLWNLLPSFKKNFKLAIINNGNALAKKYWDKKFDYTIFDRFINSAIVGHKKPSPDIYLITCKELGVDPKRCLFMDDSLENIKTAKKLGMQVVWWDKKKDKSEHLKSFLDQLDYSAS